MNSITSNGAMDLNLASLGFVLPQVQLGGNFLCTLIPESQSPLFSLPVNPGAHHSEASH